MTAENVGGIREESWQLCMAVDFSIVDVGNAGGFD